MRSEGTFDMRMKKSGCSTALFHMVVKEHKVQRIQGTGCSTALFQMVVKEKVKIENGIWISIDFICWINCYMCVLLLIGQHFKAVRNQRKETLK